GPADTDVTGWIEHAANQLLEAGTSGIPRVAADATDDHVQPHDYIASYVGDLPSIVDMQRIAQFAIKLGVDPLGGASVAYWQAIGEQYGLNLTVVNPAVDPTFGFMSVDWDGKIRMDPSSPYAMAGLVKLRDQFDLALGNDADADRHGVVTPS